MAKKGKHAPSTKSFLEYLLQWGIIGIFAVLPLLYFSGRTASYVTSKQYFLIGSVAVLAVLWVWLLLSDARYRLSKGNLLFLLPSFLFLLSMTVSGIVGIDIATSFFSTIETGTGLILLYHVFLLACIITSLLRVQQKKLLAYILQANFFASSVLAVFTFYTGTTGVFTTTSKMLNGSTGGAMMGNSLLAGAYFIFSVFLTIYLITQEQKTYKKVVYYLGIALIVISPIYLNPGIFKGVEMSSLLSYIGQARVAAASLLGGLVVSLFIWLSLQKERVLARGVGIAGLCISLAAATIVAIQLATAGSSLQNFLIAESGNRITDWKTSVQGIKERPLLGWGPENFHVVYQKYLDPVVFDPGHGDEVWSLHPHNNTLEVLVNGGVVGFFFYLVMTVMLFGGVWSLYSKGAIDRKAVALLTGMLIAFILQQQMMYDSIVSYTMLFLIIAVVAGLSAVTDEKKQFTYIDGTGYAVGAVVLAAMFPVWLYGAYFPARKMEELELIATIPSDQRADKYEHLFHSSGSYAINTDAEFYTDPLFYSYSPQREILKNNPMYQKIATEELAALFNAVEPVWKKNPYSYGLTLSLAQLKNLQFYLTGDDQQIIDAEKYIEHAKPLSPTDPQVYTIHAEILLSKGDKKGAVREATKAVELNSYYKPAQNLLNDLK